MSEELQNVVLVFAVLAILFALGTMLLVVLVDKGNDNEPPRP